VNVIRPPEGFVVRDGELFERDSLGREARRSVSPEELPPWRDSDDHQVEVFAVSSDGATIATAANLRTEGFSPRVVVRNGTDTPLLLPSNTANKILAVGAHFVVGAGEGKLQLWDRRTGAVASDPFIAPREVTDLAFAENDAALMIVYYDTAAETIELSLQPLQRLACEMANRDLSPEEWRVRLPALPYEPICSNLLGRTLSKRW
jgi:hypothetical protein